MKRILLLAAASLSLAGCYSATVSDTVIPTDEAGINSLYQVIEDSVLAYEIGVEWIRSGHLEQGRGEVRHAIDRLATAGHACAETAGCEPQRFMAAYSNLLTLRSDVLAGAAEDYVELETGEAFEEVPLLPARPWVQGSIRRLNGQDLAEIIELNSLVNAALNDWLTWMRPTLIDAYENYAHLRHLMWPVYEEAGLPEALLFGILAKESGGRVHSVSRAGAAGPLQFMQHTGRRFGLTAEDGFDLRFDPAAATRANVAYLQERFAQLNDNLELALAAYNGGEGRVQRLTRGVADPRFWDPDIFGQLPKETQEYVPYVLAAAWLFLHPEDYGLEFPVLEPITTGLTLQAPITLSELAICLGQEDSRSGWFRTLRNLNPRHEHDTRLPVGSEIQVPDVLVDRYDAHCVAGPRLEIARELHDAREYRRAFTAPRIYTVRSGDTLSTIARGQGCPSARAIAETNAIAGPRYVIRPGQQLKLIGCGS
jgi:membrane-bound lytic murein transglycosylase D